MFFSFLVYFLFVTICSIVNIIPTNRNVVDDLKSHNANNYYVLISDIGNNVSVEEIKQVELLLKVKMTKRNAKSKFAIKVFIPIFTLIFTMLLLSNLGIIEYISRQKGEWIQKTFDVISWIVRIITLFSIIAPPILELFQKDLAVYSEFLLILKEALIIAENKKSNINNE